MWCAASDSLTLTPEPMTTGVQALMSEPGELEEPKRIPLWKLGEMAGNPPPPEDWRNPAPLPPGWDANQVHTYSSFQDPRVATRPVRPFRGGLKITAALTAGALFFCLQPLPERLPETVGVPRRPRARSRHQRERAPDLPHRPGPHRVSCTG